MNNGSNGVASLQARLNEPQTAAALNRLLDRIETLEQTVGRLADALEQAPGMVAMMGDMADETVRQAAARGVDVEERLKTALALAERLTAGETAVKLNQLLDLADQLPGTLAMMGDMMDESIRRAASNGVDIEARLRAGLTMAEKLTTPDMMVKLDQLLAMADQAPGMIAMMGDIVDESIRRASESGINIEAMLRQGARAGAKFSTLMESEEFDALMESGILDPEAVASVGKVGQALIASQNRPPQSLGLFGLLSAMRDPNMQRALGFLATFGAEFGKQISK